MLAIHPSLVPKDYEEVTVSNVAVGMTPAKINDHVQFAHVRLENGPIRIRMDGGTPTAASGLQVFDGDSFQLNRGELANFKGIRVAATDGKLFVHYYKFQGPLS